MEDEKILALYEARSEAAIAETSQKYGSYFYRYRRQCVPL